MPGLLAASWLCAMDAVLLDLPPMLMLVLVLSPLLWLLLGCAGARLTRPLSNRPLKNWGQMRGRLGEGKFCGR